MWGAGPAAAHSDPVSVRGDGGRVAPAKAPIPQPETAPQPGAAYNPAPEIAPEIAPEPPINQPGIIITGTRSQRPLLDEPYAISVIDQTQLERDLPRTVPEALYRLPGVLVQKTASGHGSPYIRGFTGNRTVLVIDGIRYNNATYRDGANEYFAQVDSFTLAQIELIAGPSSSLYGSEAVGGVINLTTRTTGMRDQTGTYASGEGTVRVSSGDHSLVSRAAVALGKGDVWGFRGGVSVREYGDVRAADAGRLPMTGYRERGLDARVDLALGALWDVTLNHQSVWQEDVPRTHSTVFSVPFEGTVAGTDLRRDKDHHRTLTYLRARGDVGDGAMRSVQVTAAHQSRREDEMRVRGDTIRIDQGFTSDLWTFSAVAQGRGGALDLTYGFDLSREFIDSARTDTDPATGAITVRVQGPVGTDARYDQAGAFVRAAADIAPDIRIEAGVRGSYVGADIGRFADPVTGDAIGFEGDWFDLSGSIRAMYTAGAHRFWGAYSHAFRAPNIADISRFGRSRSSEIEVASLDLKEEQFDTFEIGYRFAGNRAVFEASLYTTALDDYIATTATGQIRDGLTEVAKRNVASGRVSGVELIAEAPLGSGFTVRGNATLLRGQLRVPVVAARVGGGVGGDGGQGDAVVSEPLSRIQPLSGNLALAWEQDRGADDKSSAQAGAQTGFGTMWDAAWAVLELRLSGRADRLSAGDREDVQRIPPGGTPGYAIVNLRAGTRIARDVDLTVEFNNILNQAYRAHGSGSNEAGRHAAIALSVGF